MYIIHRCLGSLSAPLRPNAIPMLIAPPQVAMVEDGHQDSRPVSFASVEPSVAAKFPGRSQEQGRGFLTESTVQ